MEGIQPYGLERNRDFLKLLFFDIRLPSLNGFITLIQFSIKFEKREGNGSNG